jgi:hypothetical protein
MGGSLYRYGDCRKTHFTYHSCNHRLCPQCGHQDAQLWAQKQKRDLLAWKPPVLTEPIPSSSVSKSPD